MLQAFQPYNIAAGMGVKLKLGAFCPFRPLNAGRQKRVWEKLSELNQYSNL